MKKLFLIAIVPIFFFLGCDSNPIEPDAVKMTVKQLSDTPGYTWMYELFSTYQPDSVVENNIKKLLDTNRDKFVIFARASCSCPTEKKEFAQVLKILMDVKFPENDYEIYAMSSKTNPNPYSNIIKLNDIPEVYYFRDGVPVYSIIDTLYSNIQKGVKYPVRVEDVMYEALAH
jgi:hypothetical protein